jgi:hypothetical protein
MAEHEKDDRAPAGDPTAPTPGIWYYVYYAPDWKLEIYRHKEFGLIGHPEAWERHIVPRLASHYRLSPAQARKLAELCYAMPRGRVDASASSGGFVVEGEEPGCWYLFHGGDFPSCLPAAAEERRLVNAFGLVRFALRNKARLKACGHETMNPEHQAAIREIIGAAPY